MDVAVGPVGGAGGSGWVGAGLAVGTGDSPPGVGRSGVGGWIAADPCPHPIVNISPRISVVAVLIRKI